MVLAYKGAIFGSLMVYVWPALMHVALVMQMPAAAEEDGGMPAGLLDDLAGPALRPQPMGAVLRAMFTTRRHLGPCLLFVWGVVTGALGVGVTIRKQLG